MQKFTKFHKGARCHVYNTIQARIAGGRVNWVQTSIRCRMMVLICSSVFDLSFLLFRMFCFINHKLCFLYHVIFLAISRLTIRSKLFFSMMFQIVKHAFAFSYSRWSYTFRITSAFWKIVSTLVGSLWFITHSCLQHGFVLAVPYPFPAFQVRVRDSQITNHF